MKTPEQLVIDAERFKTLCRHVFSGGEGQELMKHLQRIFVNVPLYQDTDRETVYMVAQRDLVMELASHNPEITEVGEEDAA